MSISSKEKEVSTVGYLVYAEDQFGNDWSALVDDTSDTVQVYDLLCADGSYFSFDSEVHRLENDCKGLGISWSVTEISVTKRIKLHSYDN
jgi:hypothetical protein